MIIHHDPDHSITLTANVYLVASMHSNLNGKLVRIPAEAEHLSIFGLRFQTGPCRSTFIKRYIDHNSKKEFKFHHSGEQFRSVDLRVMSPARYHCATPLVKSKHHWIKMHHKPFAPRSFELDGQSHESPRP
jgi:hypothetical protein